MTPDDLAAIAAMGEVRGGSGMSLESRQRVLRLHTALMLRDIHEAVDAQRGGAAQELLRVMGWFAPQGERGIGAYCQGFVTALRRRLPYVEQVALLARSLLSHDPLAAELAPAVGMELPPYCAVTVIRVPHGAGGPGGPQHAVEHLVKTHRVPMVWCPAGDGGGELIAVVPSTEDPPKPPEPPSHTPTPPPTPGHTPPAPVPVRKPPAPTSGRTPPATTSGHTPPTPPSGCARPPTPHSGRTPDPHPPSGRTPPAPAPVRRSPAPASGHTPAPTSTPGGPPPAPASGGTPPPAPASGHTPAPESTSGHTPALAPTPGRTPPAPTSGGTPPPPAASGRTRPAPTPGRTPPVPPSSRRPPAAASDRTPPPAPPSSRRPPLPSAAPPPAPPPAPAREPAPAPELTLDPVPDLTFEPVPDLARDLVRDFAGAIGRPCAAGTATAPLAELAGALARARRISRAAPLRHAPAGPRPHTTADVFVELAVADVPLVDAWLATVAGRLEPGPDLVVTLDAYYRHDMDRSATAAALNVHPRTLDYRLRRVRELTGLPPGSTRGVRILSAAVTRRLAMR
ncbi:helix-turn-helix domain-containing protein [Streptomyces sp. CC224B]|uniref:helix-turn-helix domain-containing protein n=1 Tax=Streptomyces sp. CC224B TaxID=3044571 RepID=UPI0024A8B888|nr:helix-turn-helix domain-containing protein [Streptomyces sp. CC224B]